MPIKLSKDVLNKENIILVEKEGESSNCNSPAGHCFGSDGGSGIPANLKVAEGRGGEFEVWQLDSNKEVVEKKEIYERCQYCLKYNYVKDKEE